MIYVAFVIDVFTRKVVGWRISTSMTEQDQAISQRARSQLEKQIHHSHRGGQACFNW